ncbi:MULTISPECIES: maturation control protein [Enterobacter cloacae complex]|uniref:maturation control protein n=1 Tax=Enterobacter cloacae complex TaxID=354276 RepID=UPI002005F3F2|nr:maturation control protein [Enterobacter roggenkampii]HAS1009799.1 maturation control protein [Enterobacter cloacae]HCM9646025.1 maturation control protein [Enterobacter hormaechei subsp. xiangfangensis]MCK6942937.1 maturation control protein [Enterobacter roggenkampii]HAS1149798.1 maturation control protein [Enterobacter cloacae]HAV2196902.1 maturation control protein [Enterobacter cloacae]
MSNQKIAVFCMSAAKPKLLLAGLVKNVLVITEVKALSESITEQMEKIPGSIRKLRSSGFKVLVDEETPTISPGTGASMISLNTKHHDGRPVLVVGIERYRELSRRKLISFPKGIQKGLYELSTSVMDIEYKDSGEAVYKVNWQDLRPEHIMMILCCYATVYNNVASADYIQQMNGHAVGNEGPGIFDSLISIIDHQHEESANAASKSLVGARIDDDTVIL